MHQVAARPAAHSVMQRLHGLQQQRAPRSRVHRLFGVSPLHAEAGSWYSGALGELEVARLLAGLPVEWTVLHSVVLSKAGTDVDHIAIGPAGVFTINTKRHRGARVWVGGGTLLVNGQRKPYVPKAEAEARRVQARLTSLTGVQVQPVIALVGVADLVVKTGPRLVRVVTANRLRSMLTNAPRALPPAQQAEAERLLTDSDSWTTDLDEVSIGDGWFAALRREVESARSVRRLWILLALALGMAALIVLAPLLLQSLAAFLTR